MDHDGDAVVDDGVERLVDGGRVGSVRTGVVTAFDEDAGTGRLRGSDGRSVTFHCVEIVDGTRSIEVGTTVLFSLAPLNVGRIEAVRLVPIPSGEVDRSAAREPIRH